MTTRFIFTSLDDSKFTGGKPQDVITDFQHGQDKIDLSGLDTDRSARSSTTRMPAA